jgi:hypothetical protein
MPGPLVCRTSAHNPSELTGRNLVGAKGIQPSSSGLRDRRSGIELRSRKIQLPRPAFLGSPPSVTVGTANRALHNFLKNTFPRVRHPEHYGYFMPLIFSVVVVKLQNHWIAFSTWAGMRLEILKNSLPVFLQQLPLITLDISTMNRSVIQIPPVLHWFFARVTATAPLSPGLVPP